MLYDLTVHTVPTALGARADFTTPVRHDLDSCRLWIDRSRLVQSGFGRVSDHPLTPAQLLGRALNR